MAGFGKRRVSDGKSGPTTLIAEGCTINGQFAGDNDVLVSGKIIGDSKLTSVVTITSGGSWKGTLQARHVIVSGSVDGDIIATGSIEIASTARIRGTVTGDMIAVAEGAVIDGEMRITGGQGRSSNFNEKRDAAVTAIDKKAS